MTDLHEIVLFMEQLAPPELAESWDNVGLLVDAGRPVSRILVALDITPEVVAEAEQQKCELIVSHHPVIFDPLKRLGTQDVPWRLVQTGISALCMHTNLDAAKGGVNDVLAARLGLRAVEPFAGMGRVGSLDEVTPEALAAFCAQTLGAAVKWVDGGQPVRRLAVLGGAGGSELAEAMASGADAYLTGEAAHHIALQAKAAGFTLVVAGHYATERPVVDSVAQRLAAAFPSVQVQISTAGADPYQYRL